MSNTYSVVFQSIGNLQKAISEYHEARYANYIARGVSPRASYEHTVSDAQQIVNQLLESESLNLSAAHQEEINR